MRKLLQEFVDLDETLPYDEAELEELNLFEAPPEVGIKDLFDNRVKYSNSDTNSQESAVVSSEWGERSHWGSASCRTSWDGHAGCGLCAPNLLHSSGD